MAESKTERKYDRSKTHLNIGTIGHVDHGKTTLSAAITHVIYKKSEKGEKGWWAKQRLNYNEIDNAPEEQKRGITIKAKHVEFETDKDRHYALIDCPGHADYIKNMITGAAQMDGAIVVISSSDGTMPQTKEHLLLASQIGIPHIVVFINDKTKEGIDAETKELLEEDIRSQLEKYGYDKDGNKDTPIVFASALKALNGDEKEEKKILELIEAIDKHILVPERDENKPFLMNIEDKFSISGQGTVVTGRVRQGTIKNGDKVELCGLGQKKEAVVRGIQMFHKDLEKAKPGDDVGINLRGVEIDEVKRGQVLAVPGTVTPHKKFKAHAYILSKDEGGRHTSLESGYCPQFFIFTADITGTVELPKDQVVTPGSNVEFTVDLMDSIVIEKNDRFIMREGGRTIGEGVITEIIE